MKNTYNVTGMTCSGCKASVEKYLSEVAGVISVTANVDKAQATIEMDRMVNTTTLKNALPEKYSLSEKEEKNTTTQNIFNDVKSTEPETSKLKQLKPLFLIFGAIVLITLALNYTSWQLQPIMLDAMGLFFFLFSLFKFFDLKGFANGFSMYDPLAKAIPAYGIVYPFIELFLGFAFLARLFVPILLLITIVILGITTIGVTKSLLGKAKIQCACLGTVLKLPMTEATFIENTLMILMAIVMLFKTGVL